MAQPPIGTPSSESPGDGKASHDLASFAGRLGYLFDTVRPRGAKPYSYEHVAEQITARGIDISGNYIWMLRSGRRDNPTLRHMQGLADFFGVSIAFLSDPTEAARIATRLDQLRALAPADVEHVAFRGSGAVEADTLATIDSLLERARLLAAGLRNPEQTRHTGGTSPPVDDGAGDGRD